MGCCYSCSEESSSVTGEANERTRLLTDPVSNNTAIQRVNSNDFLNRYPNSVPTKTDEQSALTRILHETASNVIDVAALDSHNLEQHEYLDRIRQYTQRMAQGWSNVRVPSPGPRGLLADIASPEKVLSSSPIAKEDRLMIDRFCENGFNAMKQMRVEHMEDLVVPFRIKIP